MRALVVQPLLLFRRVEFTHVGRVPVPIQFAAAVTAAVATAIVACVVCPLGDHDVRRGIVAVDNQSHLLDLSMLLRELLAKLLLPRVRQLRA